MDRLKPGVKRPPKGKGHAPPMDVIALGAKGKTGSDPNIFQATQPKKLLPPTKRDVSGGLGSSLLSKKPKLSTAPMPLGRGLEGKGSPARQTVLYEEIAIDSDPLDFLDSILEAEEMESDERLEGLICGAVKHLKANRAKPAPPLYLSLMYLSKSRASLFGSEVVMDAFCSILKRDVSINFKAKGNALVSVLACNVLMAAFQDEENWPDAFLKVFIEDSIGERIWVDREDCRGFVENIQSAFNTRKPTRAITAALDKPDLPTVSSPVVLDEDSQGQSDSGSRPGSSLAADAAQDVPMYPRYMYQHESIESYVLEVLRDQLTRRQGMDTISKQLLKLMTATCGYSEVRVLASQRLEMWLQNPKLSRTAQDLLMSVCANCSEHNHHDVEVMGNLCKIRLKMKPVVNHYLLCIKELLGQHPDNLKTLLTHTIYNELSNTRNPNNMTILGVIFQFATEEAPKLLAEIFQDLLANKDDYLRALRALFREIARSLRYDVNFPAFALGLMRERTELKFMELDGPLKDRLLQGLTDLISLCQLLSITPGVREAVTAQARGDQRDMAILRQFQSQVAIIQRDSIWWLHTVVPVMFRIKQNDYAHCIHKVLFMEQPEQYYKLDNWPPEGDRNMMLRLTSEVPVLEDTLMRILIIGLAKELPISAVDALELADQLVKRAAALHTEGYDVLHVERLELIDALLNLCTYHHPENIQLPKGYKPPMLAISNSFWKAWIMLLIISAFNPATFGYAAWENYPTLKMMMEMVMTNSFRFPPPTVTTDEKTIDEYKAKEKQIAQLEKQEILQFEGYLAAATSKMTITEQNSHLISQLTSMDPRGLARKTPSAVLEQLRVLNKTLKVGQLLCRSRSPDFLLDIIQRQGASQSMPWLAELVESSEGSLEILPVQCLCEFLLHETPEIDDLEEEEESKAEKFKKKQKLKKQEQLLSRLQALLFSEDSDPKTVGEVLNYFLKRLSSQQVASRALALKGLNMVLSKSHLYASAQEMETDDDELVGAFPSHRWLLVQLCTLPLFNYVRELACLAVRQACQVETDVSAVSAYIVFLSGQTSGYQLQQMDDLALDIAQVIVERSTIIGHILSDGHHSTPKQDYVLTALIKLFVNYLRKAREPEKQAYSWSDTQDQIILQWQTGESATMHVLVVHAMIILLTFGPPQFTTEGKPLFEELLETWFPVSGAPPSAYLVDTSEEALLLPDWLKLKMIKSDVQRLVDAALQDLEPGQLLLFVQSFGIPRESMSKLLASLDHGAQVDSQSLGAMVMDKGYMNQLIQVQKLRGATGGERFQQLLMEGREKEEKGDTEMKPVKKSRTFSQIFRKEEPFTMPGDVRSVEKLLWKIFGFQEGPNGKEVKEQHKQLIKKISLEAAVAELVTQALRNMLMGDKGAELATSLHKQTTVACPLFRILMAKQKNPALTSLIERLHKLSLEIKSPLTSLLVQYLTTVSGQRPVTSVVREQVKQLKTAGQVDEERLERALTNKEKVDDGLMEKFVQMCMSDSMENKSTLTRAKTMATLLVQKDSEFTSKANTSTEQSGNFALTEDTVIPSSTAGLLIDWLELLDPEIIQASPEIEQQLLFARRQHDARQGDIKNGSTRKHGQPYLLALLTHQSNWTTLHRCISCLLQPGDNRQYCASNVLDFLWACIHIPTIWQGRDRKLPKNSQPEDILCLTEQQLKRVIDYILEEASEKADKLVLELIGQRLHLLTACCSDRTDLIKFSVQYLQDIIKKAGSIGSLAKHLLLEIYLQKPYALAWLEDTATLLGDMSSTLKSGSQLDIISHRLISTLSMARPGKQVAEKMFDANIACRKMAAEHPVLLLRQLPMIASILKGRIHFAFGEFQHRNYTLLFTHVLGILELLAPSIFHREYQALEEVLASYFEVIKVHGYKKQLAPLIIKYIHFLHQFMHHDKTRAISLLRPFASLLGDLSEQYPDLAILKSLRAGLTLPTPSAGEGEVTPEADTCLTPPRSTSPIPMTQLAPFLKKISKEAKLEDVLEVLEDLDNTSKRKVDVLEHFMGDLKRLMLSESDKCRNTAHALVMRYIRQKPSVGDDVIATFLHCIENSNPDIVNSALKNLPEFAVLCQNQAGILMQKAFAAGVKSKIDAGSYISETLQMLNLESMTV